MVLRSSRRFRSYESFAMPGLSDLQALKPEEQELLLDVGQLALDIIGIVEPTPFADLTNGVVSLFRGDWLGAGLSTIGVIPYLGDLAKLGKIPKYLAKVERAIHLARANAKFAQLLRPVLAKLLTAIDRLPMDRLPLGVRHSIDQLRRKITDFLPNGGRVLSRLDEMTEDVLRRVFGSTQNIGLLPRQNVRTAVEFFDKYSVEGGDAAKWAELLKGIDLHAAEPIRVTAFRPGDLVAQYVETSRPANRQIGQWMVKAQGAVTHRNIGLSGAGRTRAVFRVKSTVEVLESKAAAAADHWTLGGAKPHTAVAVKDGVRGMHPAEQVAGGGTQFFLPRAWDFLVEVAGPAH
jgi:hypothetical protein